MAASPSRACSCGAEVPTAATCSSCSLLYSYCSAHWQEHRAVCAAGDVAAAAESSAAPLPPPPGAADGAAAEGGGGPGAAAAASAPLCCFFLARGACRGGGASACAFGRHAQDDGASPCSYGATCKQGHAGRALAHLDLAAQQRFWAAFRAGGVYEGASPAARDATRLRSQLEPWPTAVLRARLAGEFGDAEAAGADGGAQPPLGRAAVMARLLAAYAAAAPTRPRRALRVAGAPVRPALLAQLLAALREWDAVAVPTNTRPSIAAAHYMILRSPAEFGGKDSKNARAAAAKLQQHRALWELAAQAIGEADAAFAASFTALAVTRGFTGSPHIDKENTGPFYGLALGDFEEGTGALCVECSAFEVAHVNTKGRLAKVDGRYPHWVSPYDPARTRFSLIYYQTEGTHVPPGPPYFGEVVEEAPGE